MSAANTPEPVSSIQPQGTDEQASVGTLTAPALAVAAGEAAVVLDAVAASIQAILETSCAGQGDAESTRFDFAAQGSWFLVNRFCASMEQVLLFGMKKGELFRATL